MEDDVAELTPLAISVLALLKEEPMHAYEMYQLLLKRHNHWIVKVKPGSLYHTVERLARHDYVRAVGTERSGNRPERTTYEITPAGDEALTRRVETSIEEYVYEFPIFPVALSEAHNLTAGDAVLRFRRRIEDLDRWLAEIAAAVDSARELQVPEAYWMGADYIRAQVTAERDWLTTTIERIESEDLPWQPRNK
jgi:DNA-binding PadR family transcriptional regulator